MARYDKLSSFEPDVEREGPPTLLGDKRIEGSIQPKSIRSSAPKIKGPYRIEKTVNELTHSMCFYVPCPRCGEERYLKFSDDTSPFDLKWERNKSESVFCLCKYHGYVIHQSELNQSNEQWICESAGMQTRNGLMPFSARGGEIPPPRSVTFHIRTACSPSTTQVQIVCDWLDTLENPNSLKAFVGTMLGETWKGAMDEKLDHQVLMDKVMRYTATVSARVAYLTVDTDSQRNRFEVYVWGWASGEGVLLMDKIIIMGRPDEEEALLRADAAISRKYHHADGTEVAISRVCWGIGGTDSEIVYQRLKRHDVFRVLPARGAPVHGKPVITMSRTRNQRGVYLREVGTDTAKGILYIRMEADPAPVDEATSYAIRFSNNPEIFSQVETRQLVVEELMEKWGKGKIHSLRDNEERHDEALGCLVYAYTALRMFMRR